MPTLLSHCKHFVEVGLQGLVVVDDVVVVTSVAATISHRSNSAQTSRSFSFFFCNYFSG